MFFLCCILEFADAARLEDPKMATVIHHRGITEMVLPSFPSIGSLTDYWTYLVPNSSPMPTIKNEALQRPKHERLLRPPITSPCHPRYLARHYLKRSSHGLQHWRVDPPRMERSLLKVTTVKRWSTWDLWTMKMMKMWATHSHPYIEITYFKL